MAEVKPLDGQAARAFDELLVTLAQAGDRDATARLAARWHPRLARTARRLLQDEEQALAATQDAWLSILRGIGNLRDPARFAPWAFGILRRRRADTLRLVERRRDVLTPGERVEMATPALQDDAVAIAQAFADLPAEQRLAAQLFFVEGLTLVEIAEVQDVPVGTAKSRLFHARRRLKAALSGDDT